MKNKAEDLRNHLFAALEGLADEDKPMEIERAKAISEVAKTVIDLAKVENDFLRITGQVRGTGFIPDPEQKPLPAPSANNGMRAIPGGRT